LLHRLAVPPGATADITGYGLIFLVPDEHLVSAEQVAILAACVNCWRIISLAAGMGFWPNSLASQKSTRPGRVRE
jgi:hypothetical protein